MQEKQEETKREDKTGKREKSEPATRDTNHILSSHPDI
jgi:hypothetical protein